MHKCPRNAHTNPVRRKESKFMVLEPGWDLKKGDRFLKEEDLRGGSASRCSNLLKMLAKKFRLTGTKDFDRIQKEGKVYQSTNFGIAYLKRGDEGFSRFGFIVSTKIAKDAVDRNRFKRAMSEAVRTSMTDITPSFDVVFLAKTSITRVPTEKIMKEVCVSLRECGLLK